MAKSVVFLGHYHSKSLTSALAVSYVEGFRAGGGTATLVTLTDLSFDPVFRGKEQALEPDLVRAQALIREADHLVFAFPTYWALPPGIVKSFVDRVFLSGFAFQHREGGSGLPTPLLAGRSGRLIATMDSPWWWYRFAHGRAAHRAMNIGTFAYCGIAPRFETTVYRVRNLSRRHLEHEVESALRDGINDAKSVARRRSRAGHK